jgi:hypothetical protein
MNIEFITGGAFCPLVPFTVWDVINFDDERSFRNWLQQFRGLANYTKWRLRGCQAGLPKTTPLYRASSGGPRVDPRPLQRGNWTGQNEPFYCAMDKNTAIAEVLRKKSCAITREEARSIQVSAIHLKRDLRLIDLRQVGDPDARYQFHKQWDDQPSRDLQYWQTNMICESVRQAEIVDGIMYDSSWNQGGVNLVVFNKDSVPKCAECEGLMIHDGSGLRCEICGAANLIPDLAGLALVKIG